LSALRQPGWKPPWKTRAPALPESGSLSLAAVTALTLLGLAIRLANFDQSLFADEISTYFVVHDHSLGGVLHQLRDNDLSSEISPPLYFVLAWLSAKLGSGPEWLRLPSLIAGTVSIPLVYLLGARTVGRAAGLVGATVMALAPFMIYYSTEARAYALIVALAAATALALVVAVRDRRLRWWIVYGACACASLYAHYTAVFPLAALFLWVLLVHRDALVRLLLADLGALIGFAPWIPGLLADNDAPATKIYSSLAPFTIDDVRLAIEQWTIGFPYVEPNTLPGALAWVLIVAGVVGALVLGGVRLWRFLHGSGLRFRVALGRVPAGVLLIILLALATPVGEAIYSALGNNILGARNLIASWAGLAVLVGAIVTAVRPPLNLACTALVVAGFAIGAVKTLGSGVQRPDYAGVAEAIESQWAPGDVVVDGAVFTPVPQTGLDIYLPQSHPEFRLGLRESKHVFTLRDPVPNPTAQIQQAYMQAMGHSIFLVGAVPSDVFVRGRLSPEVDRNDLFAAAVLRSLPPGFRVVSNQEFPSFSPFALIRIEGQGAQP
jgi:4-amino-4-deoxy-L-arabinose transferase-like glycosyltransferase